MRKRPLGRTGLSASELGLGTWGLSGDAYGPVTPAEQERVIDRAVALGITLFETADCYAHGEMERRLGQRLPATARVVTKVGTDRAGQPPRKRFDPAFLEESVARSAERLGRVPDVVLLHNPSPAALQRGEATACLARLQASGALRAWGVSAGDAEVGRAALAAGAAILELAYNAFHGADLDPLEAELEARDVGVLARSVLAHGLLTGHWPRDKIFPDGDHRAERWTADELRRRVAQLDALRPAVGGDVLTLRSAALRFVLDHPRIGSVVLGPRSVLQLDQLVREAGRGPPYLAAERRTALLSRLESAGLRVPVPPPVPAPPGAA